MQRAIAVLMMAVLLAAVGCSSQSKTSQGSYLKRWNDDVRYSVRERGDAFTIHAYYNRTTEQLDPSIESYLERATRQIARAHAKDVDRKLAGVDEDSFTVEPASNRLVMGATYWRASLNASYAVPAGE